MAFSLTSHARLQAIRIVRNTFKGILTIA